MLEFMDHIKYGLPDAIKKKSILRLNNDSKNYTPNMDWT
jgi:hypothetical protein